MSGDQALTIALAAIPGMIAAAVAWGVLSERVRALKERVDQAPTAESVRHLDERMRELREDILRALGDVQHKLERYRHGEDTDPGFFRPPRTGGG